MFCAGRVEQADMDRLIAACGGTVLTTVSQIKKELLGSCAEFYEQQVGNERYFFIFALHMVHVFDLKISDLDSQILHSVLSTANISCFNCSKYCYVCSIQLKIIL